MRDNKPVFNQSGGASINQIGEAAKVRGQKNVSKSDRNTLNQIVHSPDTNGPYSETPNKFRDPTCTYDPAAQLAIDSIKKK